MVRRPLWIATIAISLLIAVATAPASQATKADNPYNDPNLVSMFDGKTLDGWTSQASGQWSAKDGVIHGNGTSRGWLYYNKAQVGAFRWIFTVRQVKGDHAPTVLIWSATARARCRRTTAASRTSTAACTSSPRS